MYLKQVTISGSAGKQVIPATQKVVLKGAYLHLSAANATLKIRNGTGALSSEVVLFVRGMSAQTRFIPVILPQPGMDFTKGLHATVLGGAADAYLVLE